jgi:hypothetical protein
MHFGPDFSGITAVPFGALTADGGQVQPLDRGKPAHRAFLSRIHRRRFACLREAADALTVLPEEEGQSVHCLMTGLYDLMHLLIVLLDRLGSPCAIMRVATLSLSRRNVQEMVALLDAGKIGRLDLLTSDFFRKHDDDIFAELCQEFHARGQRVAAARSHCKIVCLLLEDGRRYVLHGSPNLRTNHNIEQFGIERDAELHAHYDTWLDSMVTAHEVRPTDNPPKD